MSIHALITTVWTRPEPTIFSVLDCLNEVFADFLSRRPWITMLAKHHITKLFLIPLLHSILLFNLGGIVFRISRVRVQIPLSRFAFNTQVVTEFTFSALLAMSLFIEHTHHGLGVDSERDFLNLNRLKEFEGFSLCLFGGCLFGFTACFLGFFALLIGIFGRLGLRL